MNIRMNNSITGLFLAFLVQGLIVASNAQDGYFATNNNDTYVAWLTGVSYNKSTFIESSYNPSNGVAVHWNIKDDTIHLAVAAQATGWAAFGLAESGSMRGADIIMYTADTDALTDSYVLDDLVLPMTDSCQSWELINSVVDGGFIIFEATRPLNTGDAQDRVIINDSSMNVLPTRVIAAWGNTTTPSYHSNSNARGTIRFYGTTDTIDEELFFTQTMAVESQGNFSIRAQNYTIPSDVVTTYANFCFSREDLIDEGVPIDQDLHAIGFKSYIQPGNEKFVHHYVLYGSESPWNNSLNCDETYPKIETAYTWAPGDLAYLLPSNVGGPLGVAGYQSFLVEIHYNNADLTPNVSDSSGVRVYYTNVKREYDLGIFTVGDPLVALDQTPVSPNGGLAQHIFTCEEQCLGTHLTQPVTVLKEHLHMHKSGISIVNYHIRNTEVIREGRVDFWDFAQQGDLGVVQEPFQMNPGDSFQTNCNFDSSSSVMWGPASEEEMCIATLYYYPRQVTANQVPLICGVGIGELIPECEVLYKNTTSDFTTVEQLERKFGNAPMTCPTSPNSSPIQKPVQQPTIPAGTSSAVSMALSCKFYILCGGVWWTVLGMWL